MNMDKINYFDKQLTYIEAMGRDVDKGDYFDLFPEGWHANEDFSLKEKIIDEALLKKCSIIDTSLYANSMQEGIVNLATIIKENQA